MRQMAVQCAAGIVPLTGARMEPLRVMFIDAENPEKQQQTDWSRLAGLAARHTGEPIPDEQLLLFSEWRDEPDLLTPDGAAWLHERIAAFRPQIVFMGPVQNGRGRSGCAGASRTRWSSRGRSRSRRMVARSSSGRAGGGREREPAAESPRHLR
jgi:hypothetical protein